MRNSRMKSSRSWILGTRPRN